jgi:stringent starvation protein B
MPVEQVAAIYARENGAGMAFDLDEEAQLAGDREDAAVADSEPDPQPPRPEPGRPKLQRIK